MLLYLLWFYAIFFAQLTAKTNRQNSHENYYFWPSGCW